MKSIFLAIVLSLAFPVIGHAQDASLGSFEISANAGISPASTTISWNIPGGNCVARSTNNQPAWTGPKPSSGVTKLTGIRVSSDYGIDCVIPGSQTGSATLHWQKPTTYTDGTAVKDGDFDGYLLYWSTDPTAVSLTGKEMLKLAAPNLTDYTVNALTPATYYFGMTVYKTDTDGSLIKGQLSSVLPKTVTASEDKTFSATRRITVVKIVSAPGGFTVD